MSSHKVQLETEIEKLADRLESLCVEQTLVVKQLKKLKIQLAQERRRSEESRDREFYTPPSSPKTKNKIRYYDFDKYRFRDISGTPYDREFRPEVEDIVRIIKPNKGQAKVGKIIGFCKDNKLKIDTHQEKTVIRESKNVMHVYREEK